MDMNVFYEVKGICWGYGYAEGGAEEYDFTVGFYRSKERAEQVCKDLRHKTRDLIVKLREVLSACENTQWVERCIQEYDLEEGGGMVQFFEQEVHCDITRSPLADEWWALHKVLADEYEVKERHFED